MGVLTAAAAVTALPGLLPALQILTASDLSPWQRATAGRIQVFMRLSHHLDPARFPLQAWLHAGVLLAAIAFFARVLRKKELPASVHRFLVLLGVAGFIAAVGILVGAHRGNVLHRPDWAGRAFLLRFYPFRLLDVLMPTGAALLGTAVVQTRFARQWQRAAASRFRRAGLLAVVLTACLVTRSSVPAGYSPDQFAAWKDACAWIRRNTPDCCLFVTPRESFGFKWYAERAEFVCWKDCPQDAAGILEWRRRLRELSWLQPEEHEAVRLTADDLNRLHAQTTAEYLITRTCRSAQTQPVYENGIWRIYRLTESDAPSETVSLQPMRSSRTRRSGQISRGL